MATPLLYAPSLARNSGLTANTTFPDTSVQDGGTWERAVFTVPLGVPEERVQFVADKYQRKFGYHLEKQGFTVLQMSQPVRVTRPIEGDAGIMDPTRKKYGILAYVTRRPVEHTVDVPDALVPELEKVGMRLTE